MKKYLLSVLALSAMLFVACEPEENVDGPDITADYILSTNSVSAAYLENYGDDYGVGCNVFSISLGTIIIDEEAGTMTVKMFATEFLTELSNTTGVGTYTPAQVNYETGEGLAANTYLAAAEVDGDLYGAGYIEMEVVNEELIVGEGIIDGDLNISKDGDNYVIKGLFTTLSGKTVLVDYTGAVEFEDYSQVGDVVTLLSEKKNTTRNKYFSSAAKFLKK